MQSACACGAAFPSRGDSGRALADGCAPSVVPRRRRGCRGVASRTALPSCGAWLLRSGGARRVRMDSTSPGTGGGGSSRATSRRCSLPSGAADAAQASGTTKRLSELDRKLDSIDVRQEETRTAASGPKAGAKDQPSVKQLLETDEAQHVHSIQVRMSLAADDERQRILADVGRPHDALERARGGNGHPRTGASAPSTAAEPSQGDTSAVKPSAIRRMLRGIPCEPLPCSARPRAWALARRASGAAARPEVASLLLPSKQLLLLTERLRAA